MVIAAQDREARSLLLCEDKFGSSSESVIGNAKEHVNTACLTVSPRTRKRVRIQKSEKAPLLFIGREAHDDRGDLQPRQMRVADDGSVE